jgi:SAM-dependent MidA family methyltransferase
VAAHLVSWQAAWDAALYADDGFFRTVRPADHFRTSAHVGTFARALAELARRTDAATVVDLGAGGGELLTALHALLPDVGGLLIANEWLDNVPCPVVERDAEGCDRVVLVDPATGDETLGDVHDSEWMRRWWTLTAPGERAEDGSARDTAWADAVARVDGVAVAIDYGHVLPDRPPFGTLRSYADGREVDVRLDGSRDVTAHVAVDAVAAAVDGRLVRQREALAELGVDGGRPPLDQARTDPAGYVRALSEAGEAAELTSRGGLGDFWWIVTDRRGAA